MSFRTFRVSQMTCMACGHPQRCKYAIEDGVETPPECHGCGHSDSWMSLPVVHTPPPDRAVEWRAAMLRGFRGAEAWGQLISGAWNFSDASHAEVELIETSQDTDNLWVPQTLDISSHVTERDIRRSFFRMVHGYEAPEDWPEADG
jgi:hypothetical protein